MLWVWGYSLIFDVYYCCFTYYRSSADSYICVCVVCAYGLCLRLNVCLCSRLSIIFLFFWFSVFEIHSSIKNTVV